MTRTPGRPGLPDQELALSRICSAILSCACWAVPNVVTPRDKYPGTSIPTPSRRAGTRRRQRKPPADAARPVRVPHPGKVQSAMDFESSYMSIRVTCASNFSEAAEKSEPDRRRLFAPRTFEQWRSNKQRRMFRICKQRRQIQREHASPYHCWRFSLEVTSMIYLYLTCLFQ